MRLPRRINGSAMRIKRGAWPAVDHNCARLFSQYPVKLLVSLQVLAFGQVVDGVQRDCGLEAPCLNGRLATSATTYSPCSPIRLRASINCRLRDDQHRRGTGSCASIPGTPDIGSGQSLRLTGRSLAV